MSVPTNFREIASRFGHIDGSIERLEVRTGPGNDDVLSARLALRLYPWWEHPMYLRARENGSDWGFDYGEDAAREVVIEAISPLRCDVTASRSAIELAFLEQHPSLWKYEDEAQIVANANFDAGRLFDSVLARGSGQFSYGDLARYLRHDQQSRAPFAGAYSPERLPAGVVEPG